ncbi:hypothetical protein QJS66_00835 [Kocuria rhizophila]|nr:hypothetical protein QJS66_00835 [Kocuria rhizophila]
MVAAATCAVIHSVTDIPRSPSAAPWTRGAGTPTALSALRTALAGHPAAEDPVVVPPSAHPPPPDTTLEAPPGRYEVTGTMDLSAGRRRAAPRAGRRRQQRDRERRGRPRGRLHVARARPRGRTRRPPWT